MMKHSMPAYTSGVLPIGASSYSPECVEGVFCDVHLQAATLP
jgi:hypothetical protein